MEIINAIIRIISTISIIFFLPIINKTPKGELFPFWSQEIISIAIVIYAFIGFCKDYKIDYNVEKEIRKTYKAMEIIENKRKHTKKEIIKAKTQLSFAIITGTMIILMIICILLTT